MSPTRSDPHTCAYLYYRFESRLRLGGDVAVLVFPIQSCSHRLRQQEQREANATSVHVYMHVNIHVAVSILFPCPVSSPSVSPHAHMEPIWNSIWNPIRSSIWSSIWDSIWSSIWGSIWSSIRADRRSPIWAKEQNRNSHIYYSNYYVSFPELRNNWGLSKFHERPVVPYLSFIAVGNHWIL